jgi:hypothetical protein
MALLRLATAIKKGLLSALNQTSTKSALVLNRRAASRWIFEKSSKTRNHHGDPYLSAMPFLAKSFFALSFFVRCASPMGRAGHWGPW